MKILVTGGTGFIGIHTTERLLRKDHEITIIDNFSNSTEDPISRLEKKVSIKTHDIKERKDIFSIFQQENFDAVMHFAGLKAVGESVKDPLLYYENNVAGTINLLQAMKYSGVKTLVFSSSATVYGDPQKLPITEDQPIKPTNPYGHTKAMVEQMLKDLFTSDPDWRIACLRYFNPVGAHPSGQLGEDPRGIPNNLMPYVSQVATGRRNHLSVFGNDYDTPDGTGIRDYIHVMDLAEGHLAALDYLASHPTGTLVTANLGTGRGYSVLEMVAAFEKACGKPIPHEIVARRPGDIANCYADPSLANELLGWKAARGLDEMCADTWRWQANNPFGYACEDDPLFNTPAESHSAPRETC